MLPASYRYDMSKTMAAKFSGKCDICGATFPKGAQISYNGRASHVECTEREAAELVEQDRADFARHTKFHADFRAGNLVRSALVQLSDRQELHVEMCPDFETAKVEAFAFVASIKAAGGSAKVTSKRKGGKNIIARTLVSYYGSGATAHHEGWAFSVQVATA